MAQETSPIAPSIPEKPPDSGLSQNHWQLSTAATTLALLRASVGLPIPLVFIVGTIAWATVPVAKRAWQGLIEKHQLNIDLLDLIAIAITTIQGHLITPSALINAKGASIAPLQLLQINMTN